MLVGLGSGINGAYPVLFIGAVTAFVIHPRVEISSKLLHSLTVRGRELKF